MERRLFDSLNVNDTQNPNAGRLGGGQAEGGAHPSVKATFDKSEKDAGDKEIPWLLTQMYRSSPIVNTDHTREEPIPMIPTLYLPVGDAGLPPRKITQKIAQWFKTGDFA